MSHKKKTQHSSWKASVCGVVGSIQGCSCAAKGKCSGKCHCVSQWADANWVMKKNNDLKNTRKVEALAHVLDCDDGGVPTHFYISNTILSCTNCLPWLSC